MAKRNQTPPKSFEEALSELEQKVMAQLGREETAIDDIIRASGLTTACVSATLLSLEMKRLVRQLPGKLYVANTAFGS